MKQIAYGVFANAKIQCEESVSSSTPQNSARIYGTLVIQPALNEPQGNFKILGVFSDFSVVKIRFLMNIPA